MQNKFRWSITRAETFAYCRRKYFYDYYLSFQGWEKSASEEKKHAYVLKNLMNANTWLGTFVHKIVEGILLQIRAGINASEDQISKKLKKKFDEFIESSQNKRFLKSPARGGLYEDYYGPKITEHQKHVMQEIAWQATRNFIESEIIKEIKSSKKIEILYIEDLIDFDYNKIPVAAKIDFAYKKQGAYLIYDWKTGIQHFNKENNNNSKSKSEYQLLTYAYYFAKIMHIDPENIKLFNHFLYPNIINEIKINTKKLIEIENFMKKSISEMQDLLIDKEKNIPNKKNFEMTKDIEKCSLCKYKELCYNYHTTLER